MNRGGLPHSDIFGSKLVCSSPKLFAACHVLHRLLAPRHSPYALSSLTIRNSCTAACHCGRKKLPFAEYSVVKDQSGGTRPSETSRALGTRPPDPLTRSLMGPLRPMPLARENPSNTRLNERIGAARRIPNCRAGALGPPARRECQRHSPTKLGGEYRARTGDLLVANQALSQLS